MKTTKYKERRLARISSIKLNYFSFYIDAIVFFLKHFKGDYKEYLQEAMAQRVPIVAHRDHFNMIGFMEGKIPKCYQMKSRGKLTDMDLEDRGGNDIKVDDVKMLDTNAILDNYREKGCPVDELIPAMIEQVNRLRLHLKYHLTK